MKLANHNVDTLAAAIEGILTRLEPLESVVAVLPGIGQDGEVALVATEAADTLVGDIATGVDAVEATLPKASAPAAVVARPAPAPVPARAPSAAPAAVVANQAKPSPIEIIAKAASALSA